MDKTFFVETMIVLLKQMNLDAVNKELVKEAFNSEDFNLYDNKDLYKTITSLLGLFVNQEELEHYIFFCNFGKMGPEEEWESFDELYERIKLK
jgi:hypothetical protein